MCISVPNVRTMDTICCSSECLKVLVVVRAGVEIWPVQPFSVSLIRKHTIGKEIPQLMRW